MTSDELLRKFARIRRRRDQLVLQRAGQHCQRQGAAGYEEGQDGPCWKTLRHFDQDFQRWTFATESWCRTCRRRQEIHDELRQVSRQHGAALRGLLRRGYVLLGVRQEATRARRQAVAAQEAGE